MSRKPRTYYKRGSSASTYFRYYDELGRQQERSAPTLTGAKQLRARLVLEAKERKRHLRPMAREEERVRLTVAVLIERYRPDFESKKAVVANKGYARAWKRDLGELLAGHVVPGNISGKAKVI